MHRCHRHPSRKQSTLLLVHLERHIRLLRLRVLKGHRLYGFVNRLLLVLFVALLVHRLLLLLRFRLTRITHNLRNCDRNLAQLVQDEFGLCLRRLLLVNFRLGLRDRLELHHGHENDLLNFDIVLIRVVRLPGAVNFLVLDRVGVLLDVLVLVGVRILKGLICLLIGPLVVALRGLAD